MATFLQLCKDLRLEAGIDGSGPISVVGNTDNDYARIVRWINQAYLEILMLHDNWNFMRKDFTFDTVAGTGDYAYDAVTGSAALRVARYDLDRFRYYLKSAGVAQEQFMAAWGYEDFLDTWRFGANRTTQGQPTEFTVSPSKGIMLAQIPNDIYTVVGQYFAAPTAMTADDDVPVLPEEFHDLIVWWAVTNYAGFEESSFQYRHAQNKIGMMMPRLERQELPELAMGGPLC